jgi:trans-aconitate methyltransferase
VFCVSVFTVGIDVSRLVLAAAAERQPALRLHKQTSQKMRSEPNHSLLSSAAVLQVI